LDGSPSQLLSFAAFDRGELFVGDAGHADDSIIENTHPAFADCSHSEFRLERHPELADEDHVERRTQRAGDLEGDGHAPAGKTDDHGVVELEVTKTARQALASVVTIPEPHHEYLP
jgi:hypothetical protein